VSRYRVELDDEAKLELRRAREWYAARSESAAERFEEEIVRAVDVLAEDAETLAVYEGETRRILLATFPYALVFEVIGEVVFIVAVAHLKREPAYWKK
jgi:plasmid stabilization system protein ParE